MCGIYGVVDPTADAGCLRDLLARMGPSLRHRGPDGHGTRIVPGAGFGAERLRIVDRAPRADQPLRDSADRVWLVCNGEIYNAGALRRRFGGYRFRSGVDIEAIIPLYLAHGVAGIAELDGMFAFALWDRDAQRLVLARDRAGEKPLFYTHVTSGVAFASEIQALLLHPGVTRELDATGLGHYAALGYILEPHTPFATIRRVAAGTAHVFEPGHERVHRYWDPAGIVETSLPPDDARAAVDRALQHAVRKQVAADVPIGVFSSGGVDSGLLGALACRARRPESITAFSVGFTECSYDETSWAAAAARRLGMPHVAVTADEAALVDALDAVIGKCAEPLADPAALPTWLLARAAKAHVGVVLSGEGADELFGGYPTYLGHTVAPLWAGAPSIARRWVSHAVGHLPASRAKVPLGFLARRFLEEAQHDWLSRHLRWFGTAPLTSDLTAIVGHLARGVAGTAIERLGSDDPLRAGMLLDYLTYLRDNLLVKVDRATMLHGLEARSPFLDADVTKLALSLPTAMRVRGLTTKWLLKRVATRYLPHRFVRRRKRGLSVPIAGWINHGLRVEVDRVLARQRLDTGPFDANAVHRLLAEHRAGASNHARALWPVIVFEKWRERWVGD